MPLPLTPPEKQRRLNVLRFVISDLERTPAVTPCSLCGEFNKDNGYCSRWKVSVPESEREKGCDQWCEPIPF